MKKALLIILLLPVCLLLFRGKNAYSEENIKEEFRGVFISYIEISKYIKDKDEETGKTNIRQMIENVKDLGCNTIILQVRPSSDAIYYSTIFPLSKYLTDNDYYPFDVLSYFLEESHKNNLDLYAWINPYRVSTESDVSIIKENNPAYKYIGTDTLYINNGIYYNPSKKEVNNLIIKGVEEVLTYNIDGILFDDYFYPSDNIDTEDYEKYLKKNKEISFKEYHLKVINEMVKKVYEICRLKNVEFGISPDGNIDNNYNKHYADVKTWLEEDGYIDFIIPQIYYGFHNSTRPFYKTIKEWDSYMKNSTTKLYIALAFYKVGNEDMYAQSGINEWIEEENIIMKEIIASRNLKNYEGFAFYRYDSIFNNDKAYKELINVKNLLN